MFSVTGPVIRRPSAWRGEATYWIPNRPRSQPIVPRTLTSALQALQSPAGYGIVRCPWCARARSAFNMGSPSQVVAAVGEVETLVAERKVRDLAVAEREGEAEPVVEGRVGDLVAREAPGRVRDRDVADLPAPAFRECNAERVRLNRTA